MKILIPAILIFMYLIIGYVVTTVLFAVDFLDQDDDPEFSLVFGTMFWPWFVVIGMFFLIAKIISCIGKKIAVMPVSIALGIKYVLEKDKKKE